MKKKIFLITLSLILLFVLPGVALGNPLSKVDGVSGGMNANKIYDDLNNILYLFYFIAGFLIIAGLIAAAVLLGTSGNNPNRRTGGFISLGMALLGTWILYKAFDLAAWVGSFGS